MIFEENLEENLEEIFEGLVLNGDLEEDLEGDFANALLWEGGVASIHSEAFEGVMDPPGGWIDP